MKILSPLLILIFTLLLQGCITATMVGTAVISTKVAIDPRTVGTQVDDSTLQWRVNSALSKNRYIKKKARINAVVYYGKVLLIGQVPNANVALQAKQIVMDVDGTTEIFNEVRQGQPITLSTITSDVWITTKIRSQLLYSDQVKSSNIKITTENSEVFLLGMVTEHEGKAAADIASKMSGVKHVTTAFIYIK